jgi:hypothetical protein
LHADRCEQAIEGADVVLRRRISVTTPLATQVFEMVWLNEKRALRMLRCQRPAAIDDRVR